MTHVWKTHFIIAIAITVLFVSCDGFLPKKIGDNEEYEYDEDYKDNDYSPYISFKLYITEYGTLKGLLLYSGKNIILFDDDMDYDDVAPLFLMAYLIADECTRKGLSVEITEKYLPFVFNLPITDEFGLNDDYELKEIFNKIYYDYKNADMYSPEKKYGYREYPYGEMSYDSFFEESFGYQSLKIERASKSIWFEEKTGVNPNALFIEQGWYRL